MKMLMRGFLLFVPHLLVACCLEKIVVPEEKIASSLIVAASSFSKDNQFKEGERVLIPAAIGETKKFVFAEIIKSPVEPELPPKPGAGEYKFGPIFWTLRRGMYKCGYGASGIGKLPTSTN